MCLYFWSFASFLSSCVLRYCLGSGFFLESLTFEAEDIWILKARSDKRSWKPSMDSEGLQHELASCRAVVLFFFLIKVSESNFFLWNQNLVLNYNLGASVVNRRVSRKRNLIRVFLSHHQPLNEQSNSTRQVSEERLCYWVNSRRCVISDSRRDSKLDDSKGWKFEREEDQTKVSMNTQMGLFPPNFNARRWCWLWHSFLCCLTFLWQAERLYSSRHRFHFFKKPTSMAASSSPFSGHHSIQSRVILLVFDEPKKRVAFMRQISLLSPRSKPKFKNPTRDSR